MRAYRHWDQQWADDLVERGRLRLLPLSHYRTIEARAGVKDELENAVVATHPEIAEPGGLNADQLAQLKEVNISIPPGTTIRGFKASENKHTRFGRDAYIWCLSTEREPGVFSTSDTVTVIPDVETFGKALLQAASGRFQRVEVSPVSYQAVHYVGPQNHIEPSPFVKQPRFSYQKEIRIVLYTDQIDGEPIVLESEFIRGAL